MDQFYGKPHGLVPADDVASQRTARDSLFLMAQFRLFGRTEETQVRVRNLSAGGLMAEVTEPLAIGTPVEIDVRGIGWVLGRVAWAAAGRVGIAFERDIDPRMARKPVGGGTQTPIFVKPILPRR
ncbi:PilZ domain-containing protein [Sphingomonas sp. GlSt437]|uniref:PilZ domain-containing protein n=1 Tax=Sphingomonas sp. GlSt437 TaxID=3389970 RepID=UPI003A877EB8